MFSLFITILIVIYLWKKKTATGLKPRIVIPSSEMNKLIKIVLPYFIPEMKYKLKL